jgi:hypothetical protein
MKRHILRTTLTAASLLSLALPLPAAALSRPSTTNTTTTTNTSDATATDQPSTATETRIKLIINRGDAEMSRRLKTLNTLSSKISGATILTDADKNALTDQVRTEINGLLSLKTRLDDDTTLSDAKTDAQAIFQDYRVYALIVPKVVIARTADDQQILEDRLSQLAGKLQTRLDNAQAAGKNIADLQTKMDDMKKQIAAAQIISQTVEKSSVPLMPSDYNSDHKILGGLRDQLKTAHQDNITAYQDAQKIITALKKL